jgi:hypothetical protein
VRQPGDPGAHVARASWCRSTAITSAPRALRDGRAVRSGGCERATFVGVAARTPDRVAIGFHEVLSPAVPNPGGVWARNPDTLRFQHSAAGPCGRSWSPGSPRSPAVRRSRAAGARTMRASRRRAGARGTSMALSAPRAWRPPRPGPGSARGCGRLEARADGRC